MIIAGETIFFLPFVLVRIFRPTFLDTFGITNLQLGTAFSVYGILALVSYFIGGPLADRYSSRKLMSTALVLTGVSGFYLSTYPTIFTMTILYGFWGMTTILLFWSALIKATREWGGQFNQGIAYGMLDAGRGLLAAILASVSVWFFAFLLPENLNELSVSEKREAMNYIIISYSFFTVLVGIMVFFILPEKISTEETKSRIKLKDFKRLSSTPIIWLQAIIVLCAYVGYKCTDDFSLYASDVMGYNDVKAANFATISYWTRPVIAVIAGLLADRFLTSSTVLWGFIITIIGSVLMFSGIIEAQSYMLLAMSIIILSIGIYAIRGVYFALLQESKIPLLISGTAIGIISVIGYTPDIFMGPLMGYLIDTYPGQTGHQYLFGVLAIFSVVGTIAILLFKKVNSSTSPA